jgi:formylglycine-generating enzyme required for sulfatase activity
MKRWAKWLLLGALLGMVAGCEKLQTPAPTPFKAMISATSIPKPSATPLASETPPAVEPAAGAVRIWEKDGAEMVYVPEGLFLMGSNENNPISDGDECPQHEVMLAGFWVDRYEVTNGRYENCVDAGVCDPPYEYGSFSRDSYYKDSAYANYPVVYVSWFDADRYCQWAGKHLPSEAQWEKAARGTDTREYPWGDAPPDETFANFGGKVGDTTEAGAYSPQGDSPYGAADMAGNVMEWVLDWYDSYKDSGAPLVNPKGPSNSPTGMKTARSGSWLYPARRARAPYRHDRLPKIEEGNIGFRCVFSY